MSSAFELSVDPEKLVFEGSNKDEIAVELTIKNPTESLKAYKVKCTDNSIFQIYPAVNFVKPGDSATVNIKTKPQDTPIKAKHHFVVFHMDPSKDAATARKAWEEYEGQEHRKTLPVEWKEKKEEEEEAKEEEEKEGDEKEEKKEEEEEEKKE